MFLHVGPRATQQAVAKRCAVRSRPVRAFARAANGQLPALALGLYVLPEPIEYCLPPISLLLNGMSLLGIEGDRD